jgi:regulation of enolase protein 1 (concanavalin A-like superfamily)
MTLADSKLFYSFTPKDKGQQQLSLRLVADQPRLAQKHKANQGDSEQYHAAPLPAAEAYHFGVYSRCCGSSSSRTRILLLHAIVLHTIFTSIFTIG